MVAITANTSTIRSPACAPILAFSRNDIGKSSPLVLAQAHLEPTAEGYSADVKWHREQHFVIGNNVTLPYLLSLAPRDLSQDANQLACKNAIECVQLNDLQSMFACKRSHSERSI